MPDVPQIIRMRERQHQRNQRSPAGKMALGCGLTLSLIVALVGILLAWLYTSLTHDLPSLEALPALLDPPDGLLLEPTRFYDRTGKHVLFTLENPGAPQRQFLTLDNTQSNYLPASLITATLASADPHFWQHAGFSLDNLLQAEPATLAQHLASVLLLWDEPPGLKRSLRERLLAAQITSSYGREQVLIWYLNSVNYGRLTFGADSAARVYFGKPTARLSLAEAALLAAVAQTPALNPLDASQAAQENQHKILQAMLYQGAITTEQFQQAEKAKLQYRTSVSTAEVTAPAFVNLVLTQVTRQLDLDRLERGGLNIYTTLDYDLQLQAACAADAQLARMANQTGAIETLEGEECMAARLLPTLPQSTPIPADELAASVIVYDPARSQVLAMVGAPQAGIDPTSSPGRPPGTLLTPFIYLTAFTRGLSPSTLVWDIPSENAVQNPDREYHGPVRLRTALANDYLVSASAIMTQIGEQNVRETSRQLGISLAENEQEGLLSLVNDSRMTLLEISSAYGVFANQGVLTGEETASTDATNGQSQLQPVTILSVIDTQGTVWLGSSPPDLEKPVSQRPVINSQLAYLMTDVLSDEPARWPSLGYPNPLEIGRPVAAKIGQTLAGEDTWTVGYTPQLLVGTWIGARKQATEGERITPIPPKSAAALWRAVIQYATQDLPADDWPLPEGTSRIQVCNPSGLLPSADCPDVVDEVFLFGTEPTQADTLYKSFQINRATGRLATAFTPPDLIEERVYLILPPEAADWARQAGLPIPPDEYDIIQAQTGSSPEVSIASPAMFAYVRGEITLTGSAGGENFAYYRIQVGKGLNPQEWLQIGVDDFEPVEEDELGTWDTSSLDGLYTIQLLVVRDDARVDSTVIQITVDNQLPELAIVSPIPGQEAQPRAGQLTLLADATDNLAIYSVAFYMDGELIGERLQAPYAIPWESIPGEHILRVVAVDQAGNQAETQTDFLVK